MHKLVKKPLMSIIGLSLLSTVAFSSVVGAEDAELTAEEKEAVEQEAIKLDNIDASDLDNKVEFGNGNDSNDDEFSTQSWNSLSRGTSSINIDISTMKGESTSKGRVLTTVTTATNFLYLDNTRLRTGDTSQALARFTATSSTEAPVDPLGGINSGLWESKGVHTATHSGVIYTATTGDLIYW